jgi:hypothetical protein
MSWSRVPWYLLGIEIVEKGGEMRRRESGALVKPGPLQLFFLLATYADYDGENEIGRCYPARAKLAKNLGVTKATIDNWTRELEVVGAVRVAPAFGHPIGRAAGREDGRQTTNTYELAFAGPFDEHERTHGRKTFRRGSQRGFAGEGQRDFAPELEPVDELDPTELDEGDSSLTFGDQSSGDNEILPQRGANEISPLTANAAEQAEVEF